MAMNSDYLDAIADYGASLVTHVELGGSGNIGNANREAITWAPAEDGNISASNTPTFSVPGGSTVSEVRFYGAEVGGTLYGTTSVTSETFTGDGTYTLSSATINHNAA